MSETLTDNHYRTQPKLRCCENCLHSRWGTGSLHCNRLSSYALVAQIGVCDRYEPKGGGTPRVTPTYAERLRRRIARLERVLAGVQARLPAAAGQSDGSRSGGFWRLRERMCDLSERIFRVRAELRRIGDER